MDEPTDRSSGEVTSPLDTLGVLAVQTVEVDDDLHHLEFSTSRGLLTILWHGRGRGDAAVVCVGGAVGGTLGPDGALYHRLGRALPDLGIQVLRVDYRRPNDLTMCEIDAIAAITLGGREGARRFLTMGHSFGGAVALRAAMHLERASMPGVVTLATQSAGCENVALLADRDLLFFHGTADQILPFQASEMVRMMTGTGELVLFDGADHLLAPAGDEIFRRLVKHVPAVLSAARSGQASSTS